MKLFVMVIAVVAFLNVLLVLRNMLWRREKKQRHLAELYRQATREVLPEPTGSLLMEAGWPPRPAVAGADDAKAEAALRARAMRSIKAEHEAEDANRKAKATLL